MIVKFNNKQQSIKKLNLNNINKIFYYNKKLKIKQNKKK